MDALCELFFFFLLLLLLRPLLLRLLLRLLRLGASQRVPLLKSSTHSSLPKNSFLVKKSAAKSHKNRNPGPGHHSCCLPSPFFAPPLPSCPFVLPNLVRAPKALTSVLSDDKPTRNTFQRLLALPFHEKERNPNPGKGLLGSKRPEMPSFLPSWCQQSKAKG